MGWWPNGIDLSGFVCLYAELEGSKIAGSSLEFFVFKGFYEKFDSNPICNTLCA